MPSHGDAPETVRQGVLQALSGFQDGYTRRDPAYLCEFMCRFFPEADDCLILGTEPGEWFRGNKIKNLIDNDWKNWGDVRLDVHAAEISGAGDVAWLATTGRVLFRDSPQPLRFTATLVRHEGRWMFRQIQFQWDTRSPLLSELIPAAVRLRLRWR